MRFFSVEEFCSGPQDILSALADDSEAVITVQGRPAAIMLGLSDEDPSELLAAISEARAMSAFSAARGEAAKSGYFSDGEIEAEIEAVRKERQLGQR